MLSSWQASYASSLHMRRYWNGHAKAAVLHISHCLLPFPHRALQDTGVGWVVEWYINLSSIMSPSVL